MLSAKRFRNLGKCSAVASFFILISIIHPSPSFGLLITEDVTVSNERYEDRVDISLTLGGGGYTDEAVDLYAATIGIGDMDPDNEYIIDSRTLSAIASCMLDDFNIDLNLGGATHVDATLTITADAAGIQTANGPAFIENAGGAIDVSAEAAISSGSISLSFLDASSTTAGRVSTAAATGIATGPTDDEIANGGHIRVSASAVTSVTGVSSEFGVSEGSGSLNASVSDISAAAVTTGVGISAGEGRDNIHTDDQSEIAIVVNAEVDAVDVQLTIAGDTTGGIGGQAISDSSAFAEAAATGIDGGAGDDGIDNEGAILADVTADATGVGVGASVGIVIAREEDAEGSVTAAALSDASVTATSAVTGISGGGGGDDIDNAGDIALLANSAASGVAVSLTVAGTMQGDAEGAAVSDASVTATSAATGISGGDGADEVDNYGDIALLSTSDATAVSVGLTVSGSMEGNVSGEALSDGRATASAMATGIEGGMGRDRIDNWGVIFEDVDASATTVAVSADVAIAIEEGGNATGAALSDASVTAGAAASGIDGGGDSDTIDNRGDIELLANSDASGVAVSLTVAGTMQGDAEGAAVSDASVTATSTAMGISGGDEADEVDNYGDIALLSTSDATAVSVGLTVSGSMEGNVSGEALSDSSATADAMAVGIDGGAGVDEITNRGAIAASVDAGATAVGVGLDVNLIVAKEGDVEGNVAGAALSDASISTNAAATGIAGGADGDRIDNRGDFALTASSAATGVAASVAVAGSVATKGSVEGEIEGKAFSNTSTSALAVSTGIDGGEDNDQITNTGDFSLLQATTSATGVSASMDVSAGVAANGDAKVNITGKAVSDAHVAAESATTAIRGGGGDDEIINMGDFINLESVSDATSVAASLEISGALAFKGDAEASSSGSALSAASASALTTAVAIDGGAGNDFITNAGDIINLESDSTATGVSAGANVSTVVAIRGNAEADVTGEAVGDSRVISRARALGLDGGLGDDWIDNAGDVSLLCAADATGVTAELNVSAALSFKGISTADVSGTAASNASVLAEAEATAIGGGWGEDTIQNSGDLTLMDGDGFDAGALGVSASLNVSGNVAIKGVAEGSVAGTAASNATVTAEATATGIDGGRDNDSIVNSGTITLLPASSAEGVSASLNVSGNMAGETQGASMSDASVTARSTATGIDGGEGDDGIVNDGTISLMEQTGGDGSIDAEALGVAAALDISGNLNGTAEGLALSKATTTADATATGISGAGGIDTIRNTVGIAADVVSDAEGVAVAADITVALNGSAEGSSLSDVSTAAYARTAGIDAGEDGDDVYNRGDIQLFADADATSTAVSVTIAGTMRGQAGGDALSNATTAAHATATGISGGEGSDGITNLGFVSANTEATTNTAAVAVGITVAETGTAEGAAVSDSSASSLARSTGIDGGRDDDTIHNEGVISTTSLADAQATAVSVGLTGAMKGLAEGKAVADSSAEAISQSIGIYGDEGDDDLSSSTNRITAHSQSQAEAQSVAIQLGGAVGVAENAAVADSSAISQAYSAGLDGGQGNDTINNESEIEATVQSGAEASSTSVTATIAVGSAETIGTGDSSATARAKATGIEGGDGDDEEITNTAAIRVGGLDNSGPMAIAQAAATTVNVGLAVGLNTSEASSNGSALAEVDAAGVSGGSGDDWIHNSGDITVSPDSLGTGSMAEARATSTTVDVSVTVGASLGKSSSDTSSTAVVNLAGINGGSGNDEVYNSGTITTGIDPDSPTATAAMATAYAASETVDVDITVGGSFSDAASNASATAQSVLTGIETDAGRDLIDNTGDINAFSSSEAVGLGSTTSASLTIGAADGNAQSNASSFAEAFASGIDSGGDADEIETESDLVVKARAVSTTLSEATNYNILSVGSALQSADANSSSTAAATVKGIDGGRGADIITASGNYALSADTQVSSTSRSSTVTGLSIGLNVQAAQSTAGTISDALAIGIDGGEGRDEINSTANLTITAVSNADTTATSSSNTGFNIAGSSSGNAVAGATTEVTASGVGIKGGLAVLGVDESDTDVITNEGFISVTTRVAANTTATSTADSITFLGAAEGTAVSDASATVLADGIGIDGGADDDMITTRNTISVTTTADGSVTSTSNVDAYATFGGASSMGVSDASANVSAEGTGISGGTGDDTINSFALVAVQAEAVGSVSATSDIDADVTFGGASSKAVSDASVIKKGIATGIDGGAGRDWIINFDRLDVRAISAGTVSSTSRAAADATFGSTSSLTTTAAALEGAVATAGILGGSGADSITNLGRIDSIADATLHVRNSSIATADSTFGSSDARAYSVSTIQGNASALGVSGDDGNDVIENAGVVNTSAIANTTVDSVTVAIADSTFGSEYTEAVSSNFAAGESTAKGLISGAGSDAVLNSDLVMVAAGGAVNIASAVYSSDGPASSDARTMALAHASGIDSGAEDDRVANTGTILVTAAPRIQSATRTFGSGGNVDGNVGILLEADAQGIAGGEGDDLISNDGDLMVFIGGAETESTVSAAATSGATTFIDVNRIGEDGDTIIGKWVRIQASDDRYFVSKIAAFDPATGIFTLQDPIEYDLAVDDDYILYDFGEKTPDIQSVQVTVGGRTYVDASTTAAIRATGIEGGDGNDAIRNTGAIEVKASNLIRTVGVTIGRNIDADSDTESAVDAVGIAGDGNTAASTVTADSENGTATFVDTTRIGADPATVLGKRIRFITGDSADFFTVVVGFDPVTGTFTLRDSLPESGISIGDGYALGGGQNIVANAGEIGVEADAAIDASGWVLNFGGSPVIESEGRAQARSAGLQGGGYDDVLQNSRQIEVQSAADVRSEQRVTAIFSETDQTLVFAARSESVGISAGDGDDIVVNAEDDGAAPAAIDVDASATANVDGVTTTFTGIFGGSGETNNFVDARSAATAMGLDLGAGQDDGYNTSPIEVSAAATTTAIASSDFNLFDEANARANAVATARAAGIRAEDGGDMVQSSGAMTVGAGAAADSYAQGSNVIGGGENDFSSAVTEDSSSGSWMFVDAALIAAAPEDIVGQYVRFLSGDNIDITRRVRAFDRSTGTIALDAPLPFDLNAEEVDVNGNVVTPADQYTIANGRDGESGSFANAVATGIDLSNGLDNGDTVVEMAGTLNVRADAQAGSEAYAFYNGNANAGATATAEARGIATGDGNDSITNMGEIEVAAEVTTESSTGVTAESALAIGIDTGAGDDTIVNNGSIVTRIVVNGADPVAGVGILAGAGNDAVALMAASETTGSVDLGEGDDRLNLVEDAALNGDAAGGDGRDAIAFFGEGTYGGAITGFETAAKYDAGTYDLDGGLPTMNDLSVYEGILQTQGGYTFDENGSALMRIHLDGFGQLQVADTVELGGALSVLAEPRAFYNGQIFPIIQSGELLNTFDEVSLPETRPLLGFALNYNFDDEQVEVISSTRPFRTVARNANERAIADYLDRIAPGAAGEMSRVLGEFQMLQENQHGQAFAGMSPAAYGGSTGAALQTARQYTQVVSNRMQSLQAGAPAPKAEASAYGLEGILLAYNGPNASLGDVVGRQEQTDARRRWGAWANVYGKWASQDADDGFVGYDSDTYGAVLGMDYALSENWLAGASFGYSTNDISFDENAGDGDIDSYFGSLYTGWYADAFYLESVLTYGSQEFDNKRNVVVGAIRNTARSDHDGNLYSAYLGSGYNFGDDAWQIGPFVSLQYLYLDEDGFEETGAGVLNLIVDDRQTDALISQLGVRTGGIIETGVGALVPELSLAWLYDFDIDDRVITSSFAGASGDAFSITGQEVEQNGFVIGAALTLMQASGFESSLAYSGEFRDGYDAHALIGQIRFEF